MVLGFQHEANRNRGLRATMSVMRIAAGFFALCILALPLFADADFVGLTTSKMCPKDTAGNPSSPVKSFDLTTTAQTIRSYLQQKVLCPSPCFDENITMNVAFTGIELTVHGTNKCTKTQGDPQAQDAQKDNRGCAANQSNPQLTVIITGLSNQTIGPKSRCDASNLTSVIGSLANKDYTTALSSLQAVSEPTTIEFSAKQSPVITSTPQSMSGNNSLINAFTATGLTQDQAKAIVDQNPVDAANYVNAVTTGDTAGQQKYAAVLGLNPDITNQQKQDIVAATQGGIQDTGSGGYAEPSTGSQSGNTGFEQGTQQGQDITGTAADFCQQMSGGCGNACATSNSLVCRTNNPGAITCGSIATQYGAIGCDPNNNTAIFPTVEQGTGAMAALLTGPGYLGGDNNTLLSAICKYAPNSAGNNCQAYATYVAGQIGISPIQTIDPQDTATVAKVMIAMSRYESGTGTIFTPQQLQTGLQYLYGAQPLPTGTPGFISQYALGGAPQTGYYSPFALGYGTSYPGPVSTGYPVSTGVPVSTGAQVSTLSPASVTQQPSQIAGATNGTGISVPPVATIIAQPQSLLRGNPVTISWSSVGMRTDQLCQLTSQSGSASARIAQANEGSKTITPTTAGTLTFTLQCSANIGGQIQKTTSVIVQ
jgi:hypothetical protein